MLLRLYYFQDRTERNCDFILTLAVLFAQDIAFGDNKNVLILAIIAMYVHFSRVDKC